MPRTLIAFIVLAAVVVAGCHRLTPEQKAAAFLDRGKARLVKRDYQRALVEFQNAQKLRPKDPEVYYESALALLGLGQSFRAGEQLEKALSLNPTHQQALLKYSELLAQTGLPKLEQRAKERLQTVLTTTPQNSEALTALAAAESQLGEADNAVKHLEQALAQAPADLRAAGELASIKLAQKDPAGAEALLKNAVGRSPQSPEAAVAMGRFYWLVHKTEPAKVEFQRAISLRPAYAPALLDLAVLELQTGNAQAADGWYQKVATLPGMAAAHALFLIQQGQYHAATSELERLWKEHPADRGLRGLLTASLVYENRISEAFNILNEALRKGRPDNDALLQRSELYLKMRKFDSAEQDLNRVLASVKTSAAAHLGLARVYLGRNQRPRAQQELQETLRQDPTMLAARIDLAELLLEENNAQRALEVMDQANGVQKQGLAFITQRNWALLPLKKYAEARKGVDQGLQIAQTPDLLMQDAILKLDQRDYDGGRAILATVLLKDPANLRALDLLYKSYRAEKREPEGLAVLLAYAGKKPDSAPLQYFVAKQLSDAGQLDGARRQLAAAKSADPKFLPADLALAEMDLTDHHLDAARNRVSAVLAADPKNISGLFLLGNIEDEAGNVNVARDQYRKIIQIDGQNVPALNNLAFHLADDPKTSMEALPYAQQAVQLAPDSPELRDTLGWAYYQRGMYGDALKQFESATAKGGAPQWKYHLAMAYVKTGDVARAKQIVVSLGEKYYKLPEAKMAMRLLGESAESR